MKITFIGAAHEVTGSCHYLEAAGKRFLVDCGMEQGIDQYENKDIPSIPGDIDFVLLTHAHIDHSGNLPLLYARGFRGKVYATGATCDLCEIMLRDSAHIQEFEAEWRNRKGRRQGKPEFVPKYTMADAEGVLKNFVECAYKEKVQVADGLWIRFTDVGHLLGSSCIEVWAEEDGKTTRVAFSGDVGNIDQPLLNDPQTISEADYVLVESTYGDRIHSKERPDYIGELTKILQRTFDRGGNVVIPSFAVGRTQEMLYFFRHIKQEGLVQGHPNFSVYVDSPLAVEATSIFNEHTRDCFDEEAMELVNQGINPIAFPGLKLSVTSDESKQINFDKNPKVILSASGMCEAGRIKHHLKHNLWRPESTILFVGYQAANTLGRKLLDGAQDVKLFNEPITVQAEILQLPGISGHADQTGLLNWLKGFKEKPKKVFVVHGEDTVCDTFADLVTQELGIETMAPFSGTEYDLTNNICLIEEKGVVIQKKTPREKKATTVYDRLLQAGQRLMGVIQKNKDGANKDLAKFAGQINSLCDKWIDKVKNRASGIVPGAPFGYKLRFQSCFNCLSYLIWTRCFLETALDTFKSCYSFFCIHTFY